MPFDLPNDPLWHVIDSHPMPRDASGQSFVDQLIRRYKIRRKTAERAVQEYKRFVYLVAIGQGERRVPSKAVDHVWHLHMQHTRDYWDVFCAAIGRPLHHTPGGAGAAHLQDYDRTREAYEAAFGAPPPRGIWRRIHRGQALAMGAFFAIFLVIGMQGLASGALPAVLFALVGGLGVAYSAAVQTPWGRAYLTFEFYGGWGDGNDGDCGGDGGGCGGD